MPAVTSKVDHSSLRVNQAFIILGLLAGFVGGWVNAVIMRAMDTLMEIGRASCRERVFRVV